MHGIAHATAAESRTFEADTAKLLHLMDARF